LDYFSEKSTDMAESLVWILVRVSYNEITNLYLVENFHLHKISNESKKLLRFLVRPIVQLQVQNWWKEALLFLVFKQYSAQHFNRKVCVMPHLVSAPKIKRANPMNYSTK
jgi:hypothetical protein